MYINHITDATLYKWRREESVLKKIVLYEKEIYDI